MQLNNQQLFLTGVDASGIYAGLDTALNETNIKDENGYKISFYPSDIQQATVLKRFDGVANVWSVKFVAPTLPAGCCEEIRKAGINIRLVRGVTPHFDHETYLDSYTHTYFHFPFEEYALQAVTAAEIAANIMEQINHSDAYFSGHVYTAALDATDVTNETITITSKHPDIPFETWNNQYNSVQHTITEKVAAQGTTLSDEDMKRHFNLGIGFIPGKDVDVTWQGGKNPAIITLTGLRTTTTAAQLPYSASQNAVHNYNANARFALEIWLNCDEAGYAAFFAALDAALPAVTIEDITPV